MASKDTGFHSSDPDWTRGRAQAVADAAPDLARTCLNLMAQLEDAKAAQALVVERAAEACEDYPRVAPSEEEWTRYDEQIEHSQQCIRALADPAGVEALAALRAERDELADSCERRGRVWLTLGRQRNEQRHRAEKAEAERDDALARLAAAEKRSKENWNNLQRLRDLAKGWDPDDFEEGPFCRDCADEDGRCPHSGFPCDPQEEAEERISNTRARLAAAEARVAALREAITEASDPDFIWGAMDNVHDAETTLDDYAAAVSRAIRAALASAPGGAK